MTGSYLRGYLQGYLQKRAASPSTINIADLKKETYGDQWDKEKAEADAYAQKIKAPPSFVQTQQRDMGGYA